MGIERVDEHVTLDNLEDQTPLLCAIVAHARSAASREVAVLLVVLFGVPFKLGEEVAERGLKAAGLTGKLLKLGGKVAMESKPERRACALAWNTSSRVSRRRGSR